MPGELPHIILPNAGESLPFTSKQGGGSSKFEIETRDRHGHSTTLKGQLSTIERAAISKKQALGTRPDPIEAGIIVTFESAPGFELKFDSLEQQRSGIELLNVREEPVGSGTNQLKTIATVRIPLGKISQFYKKIDRYEKENVKKSGRPKNEDLVANISSISLATLRCFYTDSLPFPPEDQQVRWELWLRSGYSNPDESRTLENKVRELSGNAQIHVGQSALRFPEVTILLATASANQLSNQAKLLDTLAEIRLASDTAEFFVGLTNRDQREWMQEALGRLQIAGQDAPAVCLLDYGVNQAHPFLAPHLAVDDLHSLNPAWGVADTHGHGTALAGLAAYGDLVPVLVSQQPIIIRHVLESVKVLQQGVVHPEELWGAITAEGIARAEISKPQRRRVVCLAISAAEYRGRGTPSSWSAEIDNLAVGADNGSTLRRLIFVAGGNTDPATRHEYPANCDTQSVHDPAQAWNCVTVGAYTEKVTIGAATPAGWTVLAASGLGSPSSTTSLSWANEWPYKPDVVFEGGNMLLHPAHTSADYSDDLLLLTTSWQPNLNLLTTAGDTSSAVALAAKFGVELLEAYPQLWPETLRGLMVHSAEWTRAMRTEASNAASFSLERRLLLRKFGYGVPQMEMARWSATNSASLVIQDEIQPFRREGTRIITNEFRLHRLPWPADALRQLHGTQVQLRVTLSYFIEPNPGNRGWSRRFAYASHALRFEMKGPSESETDFRSRINKIDSKQRLADEVANSSPLDWSLGKNIRTKGSVHRDDWVGTAAELAECNLIAVYPTIGWWRDRPFLQKVDARTRYSLIITVKSPLVETDLYTPVVNQLAVPIDLPEI